MHYHTKLYFNSNTARIMIEVKNLHKSFDNKIVLDGLNLEIEKGSSSVIIGGSGTGKSVLIKCILGKIFGIWHANFVIACIYVMNFASNSSC